MSTLGWITPNPTREHTRALVMASRFELHHWWQVPGFLRQSMRAWRQVATAPGALGAALRARPLRREFWTLSAWTDEAALQAYARAEPHRTVMRAARPSARSAEFVTWTVPVAQLPLSWGAAEAALAQHRAGRNPTI